MLVTGISPPASPETGNQTRAFSLKEAEALNLWVDLLRAGGGIVHPTERIDSIRFSKVCPSVTPFCKA